MVEENRYDVIGDPIKMLLEESLTLQRNDIMDNFDQILQWRPIVAEAPLTSNHFGGAFPLKVQVNFDIPLFEGWGIRICFFVHAPKEVKV